MNIGYLFIFLAFLLYLLNNNKKPLVGGDRHDKKKIPSYISIDTNEKMKIWGLLTNNKNFQDELADYLTLEYATDNNDDNEEQIKTLKNKLDSRNYNAFLDNIYNHFETLDSSDASQEIITLQSFFIDNKQTDMINEEQPVMATAAADEQPVMAADEQPVMAADEQPVMATAAADEQQVMATAAADEQQVMATAAADEQPVMATAAADEQPVMAADEQPVMVADEQPVMVADEQPVMAIDAVSQQQSAEISNKQEDKANEKEISEEIILSMQQKGRVYSCILSNVD